jgi:hypothetical protein
MTQKMTENLILLAFVMLVRLVLPGVEGSDDPEDDRKPCYLYVTMVLYQQEKGVSNTKDDRQPCSHGIRYARARPYQGMKEVMTPKTTKNLVIFISLWSCINKRKDLAIQKTTDNLVLMAFVMPGLVLTRG